MSSIGKLQSFPMPGSQWARVRDEYGNDWSVPAKDLPRNVKEGDQLAYRVDFSTQQSPNLQVLKKR